VTSDIVVITLRVMSDIVVITLRVMSGIVVITLRVTSGIVVITLRVTSDIVVITLRVMSDIVVITLRVMSGITRSVMTTMDGKVSTFDLHYDASGSDIFCLHAGPDGRVYGGSILPEHLFRYDPKSVSENVCSSHFSGPLEPKTPTEVGTTYIQADAPGGFPTRS